MWWSMPLIPTVQMLWQEDQEFDALAWAILLKSNDNYNAPHKKTKKHKNGSAYAISWANWISRDGARAVYDLTIFLVDLFFRGAENHIFGIYCS